MLATGFMDSAVVPNALLVLFRQVRDWRGWAIEDLSEVLSIIKPFVPRL